jgi:glycosyltransferase involved in cell wall biosynthesis
VNIAIVSKSDSHGGGAGRVAEGLNHLLNETDGMRSTHYVSWAGKPFGGTLRRLYGKHHKVVRTLHRATRHYGFHEYLPFEMIGVVSNDLIAAYDLFHFHDLTTAISPATLGWISERRPVVWTFHDCSPFTGGCLHPAENCQRYKEHCGDCPNVGVWPLTGRRDRTRALLHQKRRLLRSGRIRCVAPSAWLADKAWESGNLAERPTVIPNPVDTRVFAPPRDRRAVREKLGIPQDRPIVLYTAGDLACDKKGAPAVAAVMRALADLNPFLLLVGRYSLEAAETYDGLDRKFAGYRSTSEELAEIYGAADLAVNFSTTDNLPLVVLETMACGVPCVGYRTGGIPEMIVHGETGLIVGQNDVEGAARAVRELLERGPALEVMGRAARARAEREYSTEAFVSRHRALYEGMLG